MTQAKTTQQFGNQTYGQMWVEFRDKYNGMAGYTERELRQIHNKWRKIVSQL